VGKEEIEKRRKGRERERKKNGKRKEILYVNVPVY